MQRVAVIILTWNARKHIPGCLASLSKQSYPKDHYRVVVVDNNSDDDTVAWIRGHHPDVVIIENEKNYGYAGGNNIAMHWAYDQGFDSVVILNDDMEAHPSWLSELVHVAEQSDSIGLVQSKVLFMHEKYRVNTVGNPLHPLGFSWSGGYKTLSSQHQTNKPVTLATGSCVLIKRSVIETIGYFDSKLFMYHEDVDYSWRARLAGFDVWLAVNSKVYHDHTFSFGKNKIFYLSERNRLVVYFSSYRLWTLLLFAPAFIATEIAMIVYAFSQHAGLVKIKSYAGLVAKVPHIIHKRKEIKRIRKVPDRSIVGLADCKLDFEDVNNILITYLFNPLSCMYFKIFTILVR